MCAAPDGWCVCIRGVCVHLGAALSAHGQKKGRFVRTPASVLYFKARQQGRWNLSLLPTGMLLARACVVWTVLPLCLCSGCRCCRGVSCPNVVSGVSCCLCWGIPGCARVHLWVKVAVLCCTRGHKNWCRPQQTASWAARALSCGEGDTCGGGCMCIVAHFGLAFTVLTVLCGSERSSYTSTHPSTSHTGDCHHSGQQPVMDMCRGCVAWFWIWTVRCWGWCSTLACLLHHLCCYPGAAAAFPKVRSGLSQQCGRSPLVCSASGAFCERAAMCHACHRASRTLLEAKKEEGATPSFGCVRDVLLVGSRSACLLPFLV